MRSLAKLFWIDVVLLASTCIPMACANEGEIDARPDASEPWGETPPEVSDGSELTEAGAEGEAEAGGANPCSASGLCVLALPVQDPTTLTAVWGSSANDVWAVGSASTVLHYDGAKWEKAAATPTPGAGYFTLRSVWLDRPDDVWIADGQGIRHTNGWKGPDATEWDHYKYSVLALFFGIPLTIRGTEGTVWIARGLSGISISPALNRVQGWADGGPYGGGGSVGGGVSGAITTLAVPRSDETWLGTRSAVSSTYASRVFRLAPSGDGGTPAWRGEEYDPRTWRALFGAWGDDNAVWFVGEGGVLRRITRDALADKKFEVVTSPSTADLHGVFGFGADDVWAVGEEATVLHWDGTSWSKLSTPFDGADHKPRLLAVWGSSPADVWITGDGTMLHYREGRP